MPISFSRFPGKQIQVGMLILAIICKSALTYYFFQLETDKIHQVVAAKNLLEGHGLTINGVHVSNLSADSYEPVVGWPPAYSLLVSFFHLFIKDFTSCCILIDILSICVFFIVLWKLLRRLAIPYAAGNLLLLFSGLTITAYVVFSSPTDIMSVALCLYGIYLTGGFVEKPVNPLTKGLLLGTVAVLPALLRYMYIPVAFVIPVFLIWNGIKTKSPVIKKSGIISLITSIALVGVLLIFQKYYTGYTTYSSSTLPAETGLFLKNLLAMDPFIFRAFINVDFFLIQVSTYLGIDYNTGFTILRIVHFPVFVWLLYKLTRFIIAKGGVLNDSPQVFVGLSGMVSVVVVALLAALSATHSAELHFFSVMRWTYIQESRYFAFAMVVVPVMAGYYLFVKPVLKRRVNKVMRVVFIAILSLGIMHDFYYLVRHFEWGKHNSVHLIIDEPQAEFIQSFIREKSRQKTEVAVSGIHGTYAAFSILHGGKGLFDCTELNSDIFSSEKPVVVLLVTRKDQFSSFEKFLKRKNVKQEAKIGETYFMSLYVPPNK